MSHNDQEESAPVLDPLERVSEVTCGLLTAMTITGSLSVATAGRGDVHTMMLAALGCNLAWGLVDGVMYLVNTVAERTRRRAFLTQLRNADPVAGQRLLLQALPLPKSLATSAEPEMVEMLRRHIVALPPAPTGLLLGARDLRGALGMILLLVLATFPVVVPFIVIDELRLALRVSHALSLVMLFAAGWVVGRYAGGSPWRSGLAMALIALALFGAIVALGG